jgi:AcrR family transcriptional regulator
MTNAAAPHFQPPKQDRSKRTLERIVEASLELLATEGPAGLTVHAVVERAESSVGSFYARFKGKDDLLDYLGGRIWTEALDRWETMLASQDWSDADLGDVVEGSCGLLIDAQRSRSVYLRALDRAARSPSDAYETFQTRLLDGLASLLLAYRSEIHHSSPELAVRLGLRAVLGVVESEMRRPDDRLDRDDLKAEASKIFSGYLGGSVPEGGSGGFEFFDVWS